MTILISTIFITYLILIIFLLLGWEKGQLTEEVDGFEPSVSVIIAVRNEEANINSLLESLSNQAYAKEKYEIILINDHSTDKTKVLIEAFIKSSNQKIIVLDLIKETGKKSAVKLGISKANGEIILTTDGDCSMGPDWLKAMITPFADDRLNLLSGPVNIAPQESFFARIQAIEFSSLIAAGAATLNFGRPSMANAANMAFRKKVYHEISNPAGSHRSSGDDVFLLHQWAKQYPGSISFSKDDRAIVSTKPAFSIKSFFEQRKRWAGKWSAYKSPFTVGLALFIFLVNITTLILPVLVLMDSISWLLAVNLFIARMLFEFFFLKNVQNFFRNKFLLHEFIILAVIYPFYVTLTGFIGSISNYTWKGRRSR